MRNFSFEEGWYRELVIEQLYCVLEREAGRVGKTFQVYEVKYIG